MKDEALHIHTLQSNLVLKTEKFYQRVICEKNPWSCHPIEHQMSAVYNITHGLGLAIVTPAGWNLFSMKIMLKNSVDLENYRYNRFKPIL